MIENEIMRHVFETALMLLPLAMLIAAYRKEK